MRRALHLPPAALAVALAAAAPRLAAAEEPPQLMISPLTGEMPGELRDVPDVLTRQIHQSFRDRGVRAEIANAPFTDTAAIVGCDPGSEDCLDFVASTLNVAKLLYGEVKPGEEPGTVAVSLVLFTRGEPLLRREYTLRGATPDELAAALGAAAQGIYDAEPDDLAAPPEIVLGPPAGLAGVKRWTWGVAGGGAAAAAAGVLFLTLASQRQGDIDRAPTDTVADFQRLVELEQSGRNRAAWGTGLLVAGTAAAAVGAVLAVRQARVRRPLEPDAAPAPDEAPAPDSGPPAQTTERLLPPARAAISVRVVPVPLPGGLGVALSLEGLP